MIDVVAYLTNSYEMLRINQKSPGSLREQGVAGSNPATPTIDKSLQGFNLQGLF